MRRKALIGGLLICTAILFLGVFINIASAYTLYVPDDYSTIQAAVNAANVGDTIIVRDGTYVENVDVNKSLTIKSKSGADSTIVQTADSDDHVFEVTADYVSISGFTVKARLGAGICLDYADFCSISNNICSDSYGNGIYLDNSNSNIISNNICSNHLGDNGVCLNCSSSNIISNNICSDNWFGIILSRSSDNSVSGNNCTLNSRSGICLDVYSSNNSVSNNKCSNNGDDGITLWLHSSNNSVLNNKCSNNKYYGIGIIGSNNNVSNNNCSSNRFGIRLEDSRNNVIYLNNFINNANTYKSTNIWNSTAKITYTYNGSTYRNYLGNYWSKYKGSDANGDGIGDTPYRIASDKDRYPLKEPFENYFAKPTPSPKPTVTPTLEPTEDAFNYNGEYTLDQTKLREDEKKVLPYVMKSAKEYKVSPCLIMAVIRQESDFFDYSQDPDKDKTKFDIGYMQVSHIAAIDTYKEYTGDEYKGTEEEWQRDGLDPDINIKYGTRYLRIQYARIKDGHYKDVYNDILKSTLSAYNAGHPIKDNSKYVDGVIQGRDLIDGQRRGYEFFLTIRVPVGGVPASEKSVPGFEGIFAIAGLLVVAYLLRKRK